ncbi:hypothetical protein [Aquimarina latercula]|uniref:hypothetical protein n=1 Tax=Aquimarina latercula TaxID=987 RepID=UPI00048176A1|nr:hypothetical protein [Aquimarina latercula]
MYSEDDIQRVLHRVRQNFANPLQKIRQQTGLSRSTIHRYFSGTPVRQDTADIIFASCLELLDAHQKRQLYLKKESTRILQTQLEFESVKHQK